MSDLERIKKIRKESDRRGKMLRDAWEKARALEAEKEELLGAYLIRWNRQIVAEARVVKAEAEVERLKAELDKCYVGARALIGFIERHEGGGRDSDVGDTAVHSARPTVAAKPAARCPPTHRATQGMDGTHPCSHPDHDYPPEAAAKPAARTEYTAKDVTEFDEAFKRNAEAELATAVSESERNSLRAEKAEAELAEYRGLIDGDVDASWRELKARAEKAEAEVERLKADSSAFERWSLPHGPACYEGALPPPWMAEVVHYQQKAQLSGDLAESYRVEVERLKAEIVSCVQRNGRHAAAKPIARCSQCGGTLAEHLAARRWPEGECINLDHEQVGEHISDVTCGYGNDASYLIAKPTALSADDVIKSVLDA